MSNKGQRGQTEQHQVAAFTPKSVGQWEVDIFTGVQEPRISNKIVAPCPVDMKPWKKVAANRDAIGSRERKKTKYILASLSSHTPIFSQFPPLDEPTHDPEGKGTWKNE